MRFLARSTWPLALTLAVTCSPVDLAPTGVPSARSAESSMEPDDSQPPAPAKAGRPASVISVTDGDTIEVLFQGVAIDVRLIGVDTPETVNPSQRVECFGHSASRFTERRLEGRRIGLEFDVERYDQYGRTLGYAWVGRSLFNELLVRRGFATVATHPPNVRYVGRFLSAQRSAREADRGLWRSCP